MSWQNGQVRVIVERVYRRWWYQFDSFWHSENECHFNQKHL